MKYEKDPAEGVSYEEEGAENTDYGKMVYEKYPAFQETEERYFNNHLATCAKKHRNEMAKRGARRSELSLLLDRAETLDYTAR